MFLYQWTCQEAACQLIDEDEVAREDGAKEDIKEEWPRDLGIQAMLVSIADKQGTTLGIAHKDEDKTLN